MVCEPVGVFGRGLKGSWFNAIGLYLGFRLLGV